MIAKKYRLTERELRKVLARKKPFFSYMFVANVLENRESHGRLGILLSSKVARGSVNRNFWRRQFYDRAFPLLEDHGYDVVLVPKKGTILNHRDPKQQQEFADTLAFLAKTIIKNTPKHDSHVRHIHYPKKA